MQQQVFQQLQHSSGMAEGRKDSRKKSCKGTNNLKYSKYTHIFRTTACIWKLLKKINRFCENRSAHLPT